VIAVTSAGCSFTPGATQTEGGQWVRPRKLSLPLLTMSSQRQAEVRRGATERSRRIGVHGDGGHELVVPLPGQAA